MWAWRDGKPWCEREICKDEGLHAVEKRNATPSANAGTCVI